MTSSAAGLLSMLPVMAMGLCALAGRALLRWPGTFRGILLGSLMIAAACSRRGLWWHPTGLIATALLAGVIRQALGDLQQAFSVMALVVVVLLIMTLWLTPQSEGR